MSHELRTPLNAVIGFSEIITAQSFGAIGQPRYLDYAGDILKAGRHMLRPETALFSYDLFRGKGRVREHLLNSGFAKAMEGGAIGMLNVGATCAGAGIIVGVVALTGLGLKFSSIVIDYAAGSLLLTAIFTSLVVWIVGLAVPVTASYIICAVIAAPALIKLGVPDFAAHM